MSEEQGERKSADSRAWLGDPIDHGGGYRSAEPPKWVPEVGCCAVEAAGSVAVLLALAAASLHLFVR